MFKNSPLITIAIVIYICDIKLCLSNSIFDHFNSLQNKSIAIGESPVFRANGGKTAAVYLPGKLPSIREEFYRIDGYAYCTAGIEFHLVPEHFKGLRLSLLTIKIKKTEMDLNNTAIKYIPFNLHGTYSLQNLNGSVQSNNMINETDWEWDFISSKRIPANFSGTSISFNITGFLNNIKSQVENIENVQNILVTLQITKKCWKTSNENENQRYEEECRVFHPQRTKIDNYVRIDYYTIVNNRNNGLRTRTQRR